jgi:hypothetical protein
MAMGGRVWALNELRSIAMYRPVYIHVQCIGMPIVHDSPRQPLFLTQS